MIETLTEHMARLESLRGLRAGDRVRVRLSGRTGTLVERRKVHRDGWTVLWDEPLFGVESGRVSTQELEREV